MTTTTDDLGTARTGAAPGTPRRGGLSLAQGAALSVGAVLGTGVITLPALAADLAGPASLVAWAALVVLSVPLASTFAALGSRYPDSGGVSTYVRRAFGDRAAGAVGWCFFFAVPVGAPPASMMAGGYVADVVGGGRATTVGVALALILGTAAMNAAGLRFSGRVQLGLATVLALLMTATMALALPHGSTDSLTPFAPNGWTAVGSAAAVLVWGFAGWEAVASLAGEYRNPRRDVPRATAIAVTVVGVLYLGLATTSILVLGPAAGRSQAPLSDLLAIALGEQARVVTAVVAVLLTVGAMNAYFAGGSRLGASLATEGALPGWLAQGSGVGRGAPTQRCGDRGSLDGVAARHDGARPRPDAPHAAGHGVLHARLRARHGVGGAAAAAVVPGVVDGCDRLRERRRAARGERAARPLGAGDRQSVAALPAVADQRCGVIRKRQDSPS